MRNVQLRKDDPLGSDLHIDGLLTDVSIAYKNDSYIVDQLAPVVKTRHQTDKYATYDQSPWFRNEATLRAGGTKSEGSGWTVSNGTFSCDRYSHRKEIIDEDRDNADSVFSLDSEAAEFVTDKIMMNREVDWSTTNFTTSVWTTDKVGGTDFTKYSDYAASTPLVDILEYKDVVEALIAREPNMLTMGKEAWTKLRFHPDIVDSMKTTDVRKPSLDLFANLVDMEKVLVGKGIYTTTAKGTAEGSVTYTRIWGKHMLMMYVPSRPSLRTPAAAYTFVWNRVPNADMYIKRMRDEEREVDIIEANTYYDHKVVGANAGLFMQNVVA